jgi:aryl-alcohol dehydrogenase-like predicted oxidoreductase
MASGAPYDPAMTSGELANTIRRRPFGRTGRSVSALGVGTWGMGGGVGGWSGSDDRRSVAVLQGAVDAGITFFDAALVYGAGHSDELIAALARANPASELFLASKIPPKNREWPARPGSRIRDVFPPDYIRASAEAIMRRHGGRTPDLVQFHVWQDAWADDPGWQVAVEALRRDGLARHVGISVNRREPANVIRTLRTGLIDAVQVVYNVFDQAPEVELFPACQELGVAVIARVPLDEGSLAGTLTAESRWPDGDFRNAYFAPASLRETVERVEALRPLVPEGQTMAQLALRFIFSSPDVATVIPGMRTLEHLAANVAAAEAGPLPGDVLAALRAHRWDRPPSRASMS